MWLLGGQEQTPADSLEDKLSLQCFTVNCSEVTIIPTYDTDVLGYWVAENEELLTELKIDLAPSASRCTINLQVLIIIAVQFVSN